MPITAQCNTITLKLPYGYRHLLQEIKALGGRFNAENKSWTIPDCDESQALAIKLSTPLPSPKAPPSERVKNIANVSLELLNGLRIGRYQLTDVSENRVLIERVQMA